MIYKFTKRAEKALELANEVALELGHDYIGTEHLLYGLVKEGSGIASKVLENQGVTAEKVLEEIDILIGINDQLSKNTIVSLGFTPRCKGLLKTHL